MTLVSHVVFQPPVLVLQMVGLVLKLMFLALPQRNHRLCYMFNQLGGELVKCLINLASLDMNFLLFKSKYISPLINFSLSLYIYI